MKLLDLDIPFDKLTIDDYRNLISWYKSLREKELQQRKNHKKNFDERRELKIQIKKLQEFKDYVHKRLDDAGIEKNPEGEHSEAGCRIGDRLDLALKKHNVKVDAKGKPSEKETYSTMTDTEGYTYKIKDMKHFPKPIRIQDYYDIFALEETHGNLFFKQTSHYRGVAVFVLDGTEDISPYKHRKNVLVFNPNIDGGKWLHEGIWQVEVENIIIRKLEDKEKIDKDQAKQTKRILDSYQPSEIMK